MTSVIITGAGSGIGLELVKVYLHRSDFNVIAIARNTKQLDNLRKDRLTIINADLVLDYEPVIEQLRKSSPRIQALFNNAGMVINKPVESLSDNELNPIMEINFFTPLKLIRDLKPYLIPYSHIINMSSMSGFQGSKKLKGLALYGASKAALGSLTESVAEEYRSHHIYCNCIALGSVNTGMINRSIPGFKPNIEPGDLAEFLYYFANQGHKLCNGQIIPLTLDTF